MSKISKGAELLKSKSSEKISSGLSSGLRGAVGLSMGSMGLGTLDDFFDISSRVSNSLTKRLKKKPESVSSAPTVDLDSIGDYSKTDNTLQPREPSTDADFGTPEAELQDNNPLTTISALTSDSQGDGAVSSPIYDIKDSIEGFRDDFNTLLPEMFENYLGYKSPLYFLISGEGGLGGTLGDEDGGSIIPFADEASGALSAIMATKASGFVKRIGAKVFGKKAGDEVAKKAGSSLLSKVSGKAVAGTVGKLAGGALTAGLSAYTQGSEASEEGRSSGQVAGAASGAGGGALAGAMTGAAMTSWIPIPGARLVGAAVGGLAGSELGGFIGKSVAQEFAGGRTSAEAEKVAKEISQDLDSKAFENAKRKSVVDVNWLGKDDINDWTTIRRLNKRQIQNIIDQGDWSDKTLKRLEGIRDGVEFSKTIDMDLSTGAGVSKLEDLGVIDHNWLGDSVIQDWKAIESLKPNQIKQVMEFDDWSDTTMNRLQALHKKKMSPDSTKAALAYEDIKSTKPETVEEKETPSFSYSKGLRTTVNQKPTSVPEGSKTDKALASESSKENKAQQAPPRPIVQKSESKSSGPNKQTNVDDYGVHMMNSVIMG